MAFESRRYPGMRLLNLSCPAVSQSCSLTDLSLIVRFLDTKSMPTVGLMVECVRYVRSRTNL